jgi:hypothetical protein
VLKTGNSDARLRTLECLSSARALSCELSLTQAAVSAGGHHVFGIDQLLDCRWARKDDAWELADVTSSSRAWLTN